MQAKILTVVLLILAVLFAYKAFEAPNAVESANDVKEPTKANNNGGKKQAGTKENPLVVDILSSHKSDGESAAERREKDEKASIDRMIAWGTMALGAFTLCLAIFTAYLWGATKDLVVDAKKTGEKQLRAYLNVASVELVSEKEGAYKRQIKITLKNFGQTPAKRIVYWIDCCTGARNTIPDLKKPENCLHKGIGVIAPIDDMDSVYIGESAYYLHGQLSYIDAFDELRTTDFRRIRYGPNWHKDGEMEATVEGNEAT